MGLREGGRGEGVFLPAAGTERFFAAGLEALDASTDEGFVCVLLPGASALGAVFSFFGCSFVASLSLADFVSTFGTTVADFSTTGATFALSVLVPGAGRAGIELSIFGSSAFAAGVATGIVAAGVATTGGGASFLGGSARSSADVISTFAVKAGPKGEAPTVASAPGVAGDDGDMGSFCNPNPAPSFAPTATKEVRTRLSGFGPGLSSRLIGGAVPGELGADEPFSNMARRFLTPPPPPFFARAPPIWPDDSGEAITTCFGVGTSPGVRRSNFEIMS